MFEALGKLMNESQESCSRLYECTCPEVDELTQLAVAAGAYGSRVTGMLTFTYQHPDVLTHLLLQELGGEGAPCR